MKSWHMYWDPMFDEIASYVDNSLNSPNIFIEWAEHTRRFFVWSGDIEKEELKRTTPYPNMAYTYRSGGVEVDSYSPLEFFALYIKELKDSPYYIKIMAYLLGSRCEI